MNSTYKSNRWSYTDHDHIVNSFIEHYSHPWNSCSSLVVSDILACMPDNLNSLSTTNKQFLVRLVTFGEVYRTIKSMPKGKSPSPNRLNVAFYIFYRRIVGEHLFRAIDYFFKSASLPVSWRKTYIALIPKIIPFNKATDFRPISLYNVNYKIISKILSNRLKKGYSKSYRP